MVMEAAEGLFLHESLFIDGREEVVDAFDHGVRAERLFNVGICEGLFDIFKR